MGISHSHLVVVCNEDGCRLQLPPNRGFVGAIFVARRRGEDLVSLTDRDVQLARFALGDIEAPQ